MDLIPFMASIPERRFILSELKRDGRLRHFSESSLCVDNLTQEMQQPFNVLVLIPDADKLKKKPTSPDSGSDTAPKKRQLQKNLVTFRKHLIENYSYIESDSLLETGFAACKNNFSVSGSSRNVLIKVTIINFHMVIQATQWSSLQGKGSNTY